MVDTCGLLSLSSLKKGPATAEERMCVCVRGKRERKKGGTFSPDFPPALPLSRAAPAALSLPGEFYVTQLWSSLLCHRRQSTRLAIPRVRPLRAVLLEMEISFVLKLRPARHGALQGFLPPFGKLSESSKSSSATVQQREQQWHRVDTHNVQHTEVLLTSAKICMASTSVPHTHTQESRASVQLWGRAAAGTPFGDLPLRRAGRRGTTFGPVFSSSSGGGNRSKGITLTSLSLLLKSKSSNIMKSVRDTYYTTQLLVST